MDCTQDLPPALLEKAANFVCDTQLMSTSIRPSACVRLVPLSDCLSDCPRQGARSQSVQSAIRSDSAAPRLYVIRDISKITRVVRPGGSGEETSREKVSTSHRRTSGRDRRGQPAGDARSSGLALGSRCLLQAARVLALETSRRMLQLDESDDRRSLRRVIAATRGRFAFAPAWWMDTLRGPWLRALSPVYSPSCVEATRADRYKSHDAL
jgi:hypothetical protein